MNIGFIGAGQIALALAHRFVAAGHQVKLSNRRGPASLATVMQALGPQARAVPAAEAARADWVVLSVPWSELQTATADLPDLGGRIVLDTLNPVLLPGFRLAELGGRTSSQVVAQHLRSARLVKIANTLPPELLRADPKAGGGRRMLFMSGDDAAAKAEVQAVFEAMGYAVPDLGSLAEGGRLQQFPGGPLPGRHLIQMN